MRRQKGLDEGQAPTGGVDGGKSVMARMYFGTDGIRGSANSHPMTSVAALKVGMAAGKLFTNGSYRHRVVIGKDTRLSGYMIESALVSGFTAVGMDVFQLGPMPTPAVAMLTRSLRADLGVMISASHNPFVDNGIKLFGPDGYKLSDEKEEAIEELMEGDFSELLTASEKIGRAITKGFNDGGPCLGIDIEALPRRVKSDRRASCKQRCDRSCPHRRHPSSAATPRNHCTTGPGNHSPAIRTSVRCT